MGQGCSTHFVVAMSLRDLRPASAAASAGYCKQAACPHARKGATHALRIVVRSAPAPLRRPH
jgi:hypothetical protein